MVSQLNALRALWHDTCTVIVRESKTDDSSKLTKSVETPLFKDLPCKISFNSLPSAAGGSVATAEQQTKLFLPSNIVVPPGSKIVVSHSGRTLEYAQSGDAGVFSCHQEITLEKFRRWA